MSNELIDLVGRQRLQRSSHFLPMIGTNGYLHQSHTYVVKKIESGCIRGTKRSKPVALCKACDRLMYWPFDEWYILRRYWPRRARFVVLDGFALCSADFYESDVKPRKLTRLTAKKLPLMDEPQDGLPADYQEFIAAVGRRKRQ